MRRILFLIKKEFKQVFRQKPMILLIFAMPIVQLFLLGYAVSTDIRHLSTVVCDLDISSTSRRLIEKINFTEYFDVKYHTFDSKKIRYYIDSGKAMIGVIIPPGFSRMIQRGESPAIQILLDGQDSNSSAIASGYIAGILQYNLREMSEGLILTKPYLAGFTKVIEPEVRVWYNPNLKSTYFMIPGIVAVLLTMITSLITSMGIVREREIGTLEQLMVTPIRSYQLIAGKTIPFAILGLVEITFALAVGTLWFQIPLLGNIGILFLFCFVFLLTTLGLGLFVSTAATTQQQAMFIAWFINVFALIMSGFLFPLENMPKMLQYISYLNPLRYFITVLRELFLKGSGINYLYKEGIIMLLFGLVIFTLSALRFRKRIS